MSLVADVRSELSVLQDRAELGAKAAGVAWCALAKGGAREGQGELKWDSGKSLFSVHF